MIEGLTWEAVAALIGTLVVVGGFWYKSKSDSDKWQKPLNKTEEKLDNKITDAEERLEDRLTIHEDKMNVKTQDLENRLGVLETRLVDTIRRIDELRTDMKSHNEHDEKSFMKVEEKLEKITDLMIEFIQANKK